jgi:TrmH family RNA methyltransferase
LNEEKSLSKGTFFINTTFRHTNNKAADLEKMLSVNKIKYLKSLHLQKFRDEYREFLVEGPKMVTELIGSDFNITGIFGLESWASGKRDIPASLQKSIEIVTPTELARISNLKTPNEVLATVKIPERPIDKSIYDDLVLMLNRISDPGNLGTIIRIADWFGIKNIICSLDSVEVYNPKVVQATMGSLFRVSVFYYDLKGVLSGFQHHFPVFGAFLDGNNIYKETFPGKGIIIIGNESHGIDEQLKPFVTNKIFIPSFSGGAESLNASVATAIICSEFRRNNYEKSLILLV